MKVAGLGNTVIIADSAGDRPAIVVRSLVHNMADVTAFMPLPEHIKAVEIHATRPEALNAHLHDGDVHAYWPA